MRISDWSSDVCSSDLVSIFPGAEVCPCDTTGRVTPDRVHGMLSSIRDRFPALRNIAYHGHDTYGLGVANALAAIEGGATAIDASFAGLGGRSEEQTSETQSLQRKSYDAFILKK